MQIIESAPLPPGACFVCGQDRGPFVDTDREESGEFGVHLYLCVACVGEAASLIGCLPPDTAAKVREDAERQAAELRGLRDEVSQLNEAVDALARARREPEGASR